MEAELEVVFEVVSSAIDDRRALNGAEGVELHRIMPLPNGLQAEKTGTFDREEDEDEEEEEAG